MVKQIDQLETFWQKIMLTNVDERYRYASPWSWMLSEARTEGLDLPPEYEALRKELDEQAIEAQFDNMPI
ncbi:hypothetical protein ROA7450_02611 [Roseovarius albus]|uniref:Uncharacterized protein n=1 Tax=Roseovarius albus TaxID=1247867 RepID=A0A1X6ZK81_9RHOB|nr:hypothetical protein [Roseovarius albus]SLN51789.1 hypothetical protein ROA7450_02611 [Roseovarius albus]